MNEEIKPPWIKYPEYPPYDGFWRQSGEYYLHYVWEPYWQTLSYTEQSSLLKKHPKPKSWSEHEEFSKWLNDLDSDE